MKPVDICSSVLLVLALSPVSHSFQLASNSLRLSQIRSAPSQWALRSEVANNNVDQTLDTSRDKVMTFSYDMSLDPKFEKPTYPGTGNGLGGEEGEFDVVVIGSGMGGLACGAMNALYGKKVLVLESHIKPGGSAHTFSRMHKGGKYSFEVGPSIFEGLDRPSLNPLRILIDALGEKMPVKTYTGLGYWTPEGYWRFPVGSVSKFEDLLRERSENPELAIKEWNGLRARLKTLGGSTMAVSLLNLRQDAGFLATTAGATPYALTHPDVFLDLPLTFDSLHKTVDKIVTDPFLRNFIDTMCIFCGFPAKGAMTAHMLYILERFFEEGAAYSVPLGGTIEIANTLVRGLEKNGGKITMNAHVDEILVEDGKAAGVRLKNGKVIKAKTVVSNATPFDTVKMLGDIERSTIPEGVREWRDSLGKLPRHGAILHLFLAIDATDLDLSHIEDPAHLIVQDWGRSLQDSQNLCSFFIPSLLDPSVCPPGKHVIHVYSSGGEPYEAWESMTPGSPEYEEMKEKRSQVLWQAVERCIPDVRARTEFSIVGSPLAHEAFLRRDRGTYGMAWAAGTSAPYAGLLKNILPFPFPNLKTPVDGLLRCGDSCFPGIGTPSAAASGVICANTMNTVDKHMHMLKATSKVDPLYKFLDPGLIGDLYMPLVSGLTPSQELRHELGNEGAAE
eukprot:CAMPEP_0171620238 /NCGR_PEP_ID=MMETSP0990-20121206/15866_1 /TAXON_ID=483369 /ORGANISM="non described non described, Strain CCMP2098" /LENGTH=673 /DNA_ID=CAMNT_0012185481 /DNA_START=33 /DNA_END=2054 /DNA_ORIENTATION=-